MMSFPIPKMASFYIIRELAAFVLEVSNKTSDILLLITVGTGLTGVGCAVVILWTRIVRHGWPDRVVIFSTAIGLLGITVLSVLAYLILEH